MLPTEQPLTPSRPVLLLSWLGFGFVLGIFGLTCMLTYRDWCDPRGNSTFLSNADFLYPAAIYEDVTKDGFSWRGCKFSASPDWFPDFPIYFFARWVTGSVSASMVVATGLLYLFWVLSFVWLLYAARFPGSRLQNWTIVFTIASGYLLLNSHQFGHDPFYSFPLGLTSHIGSFIVGMYALGLVLYVLGQPHWNKRTVLFLGLFSVLITLTIASDRLLLVQFVAPVTVSLLVARMIALKHANFRVTWLRVAILIALLAGSTAMGTFLMRQVISSKEDAVAFYQNFSWPAAFRIVRFCYDGIIEQVREQHMLHVSLVLWLFVSLAYVGAYLSVRIRTPERLSTSTFFSGSLLFVSLMTPWIYFTSVASITMMGEPFFSVPIGWRDFNRFFYTMFFLPFFGWALWIRWGLLQCREMERPVLRLAPGLMAGVTAVLLGQQWQKPRTYAHDVLDYYPSWIAEIDNLAVKHDLKYGLGGYWQARLVTLYSKRGVRMYPAVTVDNAMGLGAFYWLSNIEWYLGTPESAHPNPKYTFILLDPTSPAPFCKRELIVSRHGEPAFEKNCGDYPIMIYNRPQDQAFHMAMHSDTFVVGQMAARNPDQPVHFPPSILPSEIIRADKTMERIAQEGQTKAGFLTFGPYYAVKHTGKYRVVFHTTSKDTNAPNGEWDVVITHPNYQGGKLIARGNLQQGEKAATEVIVELPSDARDGLLECRVKYNGVGNLALHGIDLVRIP